MQVAIIDYGIGNLGSIRNMLNKLGVESVITGDLEVLGKAPKLILPGVGAFAYGMQKLKEKDLVPFLNEKVIQQKTPILGICLGAQLFTKGSEEGGEPGLSWFDAKTVRFKFDPTANSLKIPHMGWCDIRPTPTHPLFHNLEVESRFYFVHSYHFEASKKEEVVAQATYGYDFPCALGRDHIVGVQFHPEKSHRFGLTLLKNFMERY